MPFSLAWRNRLLDRALSNTAFSVPASLSWSPFTVSPDGNGAGGTEYASNGAGRRVVTWGAVSQAQTTNAAAVAAGTAAADWALVTAFALLDPGGTVVAYGPASPSKQVLSGQTWTLQPGEIQLADAGEAVDEFLSYYAMNALLQELTGGVATTFPTAPYWALLTAPFARDGTGGTEAAGGSYARVQQACAAAAAGAKGPSAALTYPTPSLAWGRVTHLAAFDAATSGNLLAQARLDTPLQVAAGVPPAFAAANQAFTLT